MVVYIKNKKMSIFYKNYSQIKAIVIESKKIINKVVKEENFAKGDTLFHQWVNSGDSLTREKAIQFLQNADQNNHLVKNMLNELKKERKHNPLLH